MIAPRSLRWLIGLALGDLALGGVALPYLPERVPLHWNWLGRVDNYGPAWQAALILPVCVIATVAVVVLLSRLGARSRGGAAWQAIYGRIAVVIVGALVALHVALLHADLGHAPQFPTMALWIAGALFVVSGNWLGKLRRNAWAGIRTPWTLADDVVWERTHRVGGRLMVGYGLAIIVFALLAPAWAALALLIGGGLAGAVWACFYSRRVFMQLQKPS